MVLQDINMKKIKLTEDLLKLITFFYIKEENDNQIIIDKNQLFNVGSHLLEDMAFILNKTDKAIKNSENHPDGRAFDDETEKYLLSLFDYLSENLYEIETLIHQFIFKGGLTVGTYACSKKDFIWTKLNDNE